jgi:hypothetical protein
LLWRAALLRAGTSGQQNRHRRDNQHPLHESFLSAMNTWLPNNSTPQLVMCKFNAKIFFTACCCVFAHLSGEKVLHFPARQISEVLPAFDNPARHTP